MSPTVLAQAPPLVGTASLFEVISVKESSGTRIPVQWEGAHFVAGAIPLQTLLAVAYQHFRPPTNTTSNDSDEPDLVTALKEPLGLKLESTRAPLQVTVFDRIERPTPN